jgi:hypothetical protein
VVVVCVPCPTAPPEGAVRLRMSDRLGGFLTAGCDDAAPGIVDA